MESQFNMLNAKNQLKYARIYDDVTFNHMCQEMWASKTKHGEVPYFTTDEYMAEYKKRVARGGGGKRRRRRKCTYGKRRSSHNRRSTRKRR